MLRRVRHARVARAVDGGAGHAAQDPVLEAIAQRGDARRFGASFPAREPRRDAEAGNRRHVLGAGAAVALVLAAGEDRQHAACRA